MSAKKTSLDSERVFFRQEDYNLKFAEWRGSMVKALEDISNDVKRIDDKLDERSSDKELEHRFDARYPKKSSNSGNKFVRIGKIIGYVIAGVLMTCYAYSQIAGLF